MPTRCCYDVATMSPRCLVDVEIIEVLREVESNNKKGGGSR
jgi:hypothetical protein